MLSILYIFQNFLLLNLYLFFQILKHYSLLINLRIFHSLIFLIFVPLINKKQL